MSNEQMSEAQKLHYLSAVLTNNAKILISTESTFSSLFQELKDRWENDRVVTEHIN